MKRHRPTLDESSLRLLCADDALSSSATPSAIRAGEAFSIRVSSHATSDDHVALVRVLSSSACSVAELDVARVGLGPGEVSIAVFAALSLNTSLTRVDLARNGLLAAAGQALGEAVATMPSLTYLDVSLNDIGEKGFSARAFGGALTSRGCALRSAI